MRGCGHIDCVNQCGGDFTHETCPHVRSPMPHPDDKPLPPPPPQGQPFAHFQWNYSWGVWEEVVPEAAGRRGVVAAYAYPAESRADDETGHGTVSRKAARDAPYLQLQDTRPMSGKSEWQPIESAPRDGTWFLACWAKPLIPAYGVIKWCEGEWLEAGEVVGDPTHWQALPAPPPTSEPSESK